MSTDAVSTMDWGGGQMSLDNRRGNSGSGDTVLLDDTTFHW